MPIWNPYQDSKLGLVEPRGSKPAAKEPGGSEESGFLGPRIIDLNTSGALEALQHTNPTHYTAVLKILDQVLLNPRAEVVSVNMKEVDYPDILLTSNPPQRRLGFTVDDTRYVAMITLSSVCELSPLK